MTATVNPRWLAVETLAKIKNGAYSNLQLNAVINQNELDQRDVNLLTRIVYGVIQHRLTLDYWIKPFVKQPAKLDPWVRELLYTALYQWQYLDKIPQRAVFYESIELAKQHGHAGIRKFVTGVLHQMDRTGLPDVNDIKDTEQRLSVTYSMPLWLVKALADQVSADRLPGLLATLNEPAQQSLRVNLAKTTIADATAALAAEGVTVRPSKVSPLGLVVEEGQAMHTSAFKDGLVTFQDESAMLVAPTLQVQANDQVLDACAAPGGKTTQLAATIAAAHGDGQVTALDIHQKKVRLIEHNAKRMGVKEIVAAQQLDARKALSAFGEAKFDKILVDAPCSGIGLLRRKPEIRYEKQPSDSVNLQKIQLAILEAVAPTLKKNGIMTYSTCTILPAENQDVIDAFLAKHSDFKLVPTKTTLNLKAERSTAALTIYPDDFGSDGFFIASLQRQSLG